MRIRGQIRPSKATSGLGCVAGAVFIGIGLFVAIPKFGVFGIFWTFIAVGITIYHGINLFSDKGVAIEVVDIDATSSLPVTEVAKESVETRLAKLEQLKARGLVDGAEYDSQRARILNEL